MMVGPEGMVERQTRLSCYEGRTSDFENDAGSLLKWYLRQVANCKLQGAFGESNVNDPIVDEVRRIRDEYAARFNYDIDAMFQDLKEKERLSGRTLVSYAREGNEPQSEIEPVSVASAEEAVVCVS